MTTTQHAPEVAVLEDVTAPEATLPEPEHEATRDGFAFHAVTVESTTTAGYLPSAEPLTVKMLAERTNGRLLGVQIVGRHGAAKRVDVAATALHAGMDVEMMTHLDLSYAPPFSPVWDPVLIAARKATAAVARGRTS